MRTLLRYLVAILIVGGVAVGVLWLIGPRDVQPSPPEASAAPSKPAAASEPAQPSAVPATPKPVPATPKPATPKPPIPNPPIPNPNGTSAAPSALAGQPRPPADAFDATVMWVSDGDTIGARAGSRSEIQVRLIGIDTPETKRPNQPVECYGPQASAALSSLLPKGSTIKAAYQKVRRDTFDRDLWDVWLPDGRFVQGYMVTNGFATTLRFGGTDQHAKLLASLEATAKRNKAGLWGACPQT